MKFHPGSAEKPIETPLTAFDIDLKNPLSPELVALRIEAFRDQLEEATCPTSGKRRAESE